MAVLHGKVDGDVLVLPSDQNGFLYERLGGTLKPRETTTFAVGQINIQVEGDPHLTDAFRGLREIEVWVREDMQLVLVNGTRLDGSKLNDETEDAGNEAAVPTSDTAPITAATSETVVSPGKTEAPKKGEPGKLPPKAPLGTDASSAAAAVWKQVRHGRR